MKKYLLGSLAIVFALSFSAFTKPDAHIKRTGKFLTGDFWYKFEGAQTISGRESSTNYDTPTAAETSGCTADVTNECGVKVTVTLDGLGHPPTNPSFTNVSFNVGTGMPNGGTDYKQNATKN